MVLYADFLHGRVFFPNGMLKLAFGKDTGVIMIVYSYRDNACELIHY